MYKETQIDPKAVAVLPKEVQDTFEAFINSAKKHDINALAVIDLENKAQAIAATGNPRRIAFALANGVSRGSCKELKVAMVACGNTVQEFMENGPRLNFKPKAQA